MLNRCSTPRLAACAARLGASQLLTRAPVDLALALFRLSLLCDGAPHRQRNAGKAFCQTLRHPSR